MAEKDDRRLLTDLAHLKQAHINPTGGEELCRHAPSETLCMKLGVGTGQLSSMVVRPHRPVRLHPRGMLERFQRGFSVEKA